MSCPSDYAIGQWVTFSESWYYSYDNADRITQITYPDGSTDHYTYSSLDLVSFADRQSRTWTYAYDANRRLTKAIDPLGNQTLFAYNAFGELTGLTDAKGNSTSWTYDVEGRVTGKQYADNSEVAFGYETTTSRLKTITDALGQVKQFAYAQDNRPAGISYSNAVNPTPNVSFTYDPYFPRLVSMQDGTGITQYAYGAVGVLGALNLQQESGPRANSSITYAYDGVGRPTSRIVAGASAETLQYDAIGRLTSDTNDLGAFALSYLGQTGQITLRQLASSPLSTAWSYLPNSGDRRLAGIANTGASTGQFSTYTYTTTPESFISAITESSDSPAVYPATGTQTASYNNLNQLTNSSGQGLTFDTNGNLLSDGQRNYTWDAENRLVSITYPGQPGKLTASAYDGLSRRTTIASTLAGGASSVATSYVWCGSAICQARTPDGSVTRAYYDEGELVVGTSPQPIYYGIDQIGSVSRSFTSSSAAAYSYDPYGNSLQTTAPQTDFGYAGMLYNADSGLYLATHRIYNPLLGRWISRDPLGEGVNQAANLYIYTNDNPINLADPAGLASTFGSTPYTPPTPIAPPSPPGPPCPAPAASGPPQLPAVYYPDPDILPTPVAMPQDEGEPGAAGPGHLPQNMLGAGSGSPYYAGGGYSSPDFLVSPGGTAFPVPNGATGPRPVINPAGRQTGSAFTGGSGGANNQVSSMRLMDPTSPRGASPGYPNGYVMYGNPSGQGVDPYTGRTLPNANSHFPID